MLFCSCISSSLLGCLDSDQSSLHTQYTGFEQSHGTFTKHRTGLAERVSDEFQGGFFKMLTGGGCVIDLSNKMSPENISIWK